MGVVRCHCSSVVRLLVVISCVSVVCFLCHVLMVWVCCVSMCWVIVFVCSAMSFEFVMCFFLFIVLIDRCLRFRF